MMHVLIGIILARLPMKIIGYISLQCCCFKRILHENACCCSTSTSEVAI